MKNVAPNPHNVSWDHCGFITVDDHIVGKVDDDGKLYVDCIEQVQVTCDIDDLRSAVAELISASDAECDFINENVAAWAASR